MPEASDFSNVIGFVLLLTLGFHKYFSERTVSSNSFRCNLLVFCWSPNSVVVRWGRGQVFCFLMKFQSLCGPVSLGCAPHKYIIVCCAVFFSPGLSETRRLLGVEVREMPLLQVG